MRPSSQVGNVSISIKESSGNVEHALITYSNNAFHIQLASMLHTFVLIGERERDIYIFFGNFHFFFSFSFVFIFFFSNR